MKMNNKLELLIIKPRGIADWLKIYRLYLKAFPKYERKPFSVIYNMYKKGKTDVWYCMSKGHFAGFGATINSSGVILLDYFAVASSCRGQGIGSAILKSFMEIYEDKGFFVEIESTFVHSENSDERIKRKHFYLENGLEEMGTEAYLFGTRMELLGRGCRLDFTEYQNFYRDNYGRWAADNIKALE